MTVDLGDADAGVAVALFVLTDYIAELQKTGQLPTQIFQQSTMVNGSLSDLTVLLDPPVFAMAARASAAPYTRLLLTGTIQVRPAGQPDAKPIELPLDAAVKLTLVLAGPEDQVKEVGLRYDGVDSAAFPVTPGQVDELFTDPAVTDVLQNTTIGLARPLVAGLNKVRFPHDSSRPADAKWASALTLMPGDGETDDSFAVTVGPPGTTAVPAARDSLVPVKTGLAVVYSRDFLDFVLLRGSSAKDGKTIGGAKVAKLRIRMGDTALQVTGHLVKPIHLLPDVDIHLSGSIVPSLIRGTTGMYLDVSGVDVRVDAADKIFYEVMAWFLTVGSPPLLVTGMWEFSAAGIALWDIGVPKSWNGVADMDNAPGVVRWNLAAALGPELNQLTDALDTDTSVGSVHIDATPDSLRVDNGNMLFLVQVFVTRMQAVLHSAEYSKRLERFAIYVLQGGRRFRAQELARLMHAGKITVPGFNEVDADYLRANPDNTTADNLLTMFKDNETTEVVVGDAR